MMDAKWMDLIPLMPDGKEFDVLFPSDIKTQKDKHLTVACASRVSCNLFEGDSEPTVIIQVFLNLV